MARAPLQSGRHPTDRELEALLPAMPLRERIEAIISKYVGGAMSRHCDGENDSLKSSRLIAREITQRIARWLPAPASASCCIGAEQLLAWAEELERCAEGAHAGINAPIAEIRAAADRIAEASPCRR